MASRSSGDDVSNWVGWVFFAGFLMILMGVFQATAGLVALFKDSYFVVSTDQFLLFNSLDAWGWTHLILGLVVLFAGFALFRGSTMARMVAVIVAGLSALSNLLTTSVYPLWSVIEISMAVLVIYAVIVHGGELRD